MKEYLITPGLFDRPRRLLLGRDFLEWEANDLKKRAIVRLNASEIRDFRHGWEYVVWYKFNVGRRFIIAFKDERNKELIIEFSSYFSSAATAFEKYSSIVADIWTLYHSRIVDSMLDKFYTGTMLAIGGVELSDDGITLRNAAMLIPWNRVSTREYKTYFTIFDVEDPSRHLTVSYNEYGTESLWSYGATILKEKSDRIEGTS